MILPKIGEIITPERGLELCKHFKLDYLVERLEKYPELYRDFEFDGCSWYPDKFFWKVLLWGKGKKITYECCLPHDLKYAYGQAWNERERRHADHELRIDLVIKAKVRKFIAEGFYFAVRVGGGDSFGDEERNDFKWGFGSK